MTTMVCPAEVEPMPAPAIPPVACPIWCAGNHHLDDVNSEHTHVGAAREVLGRETGDLTVELFRLDFDDITGDVAVCVLFSEEAWETDLYELTPAEARDMAATLLGVRANWDEDRLLFATSRDDRHDLTVEYRHPRILHAGGCRPAEVDVTLHTSSQRHSIRVQLDLPGALHLARHLGQAANQAEGAK